MMELNGSAWKIQQPRRLFHEMMTKLKKKTKKKPKNILVVSNFVQEWFCGELNLPMMSECAELSLHLSVMRGLWQYDRI